MPATPAPPTISVSLIAAVDRANGIGRANGLLVRLPEDMRHFKARTMGHPIVMGRKTWDSIGRPLPGRLNIVVTRDSNRHFEGARRAHSFDDAVQIALAAVPSNDVNGAVVPAATSATVAGPPMAPLPVRKLCVIGGAEIYALAMPHAHELLLTELDATFEADTFFPNWPRGAFTEVARESHQSEHGLNFAFVTYQKN